MFMYSSNKLGIQLRSPYIRGGSNSKVGLSLKCNVILIRFLFHRLFYSGFLLSSYFLPKKSCIYYRIKFLKNLPGISNLDAKILNRILKQTIAPIFWIIQYKELLYIFVFLHFSCLICLYVSM